MFYRPVHSVGDRSLIHIFVVSSPVIFMIANAYAETLPCQDSSVYLWPYREQPLNRFNKIRCWDSKYSRFLLRLAPWIYVTTCLLLSGVYSKDFYLYCSFDFDLSIAIRKSHRCRGIYYLEEGQLSFNPHNIKHLPPSARYVDRQNLKYLRRYYDESDARPLYSLDAHGFIVSSSLAFPFVDDSYKYVVDIRSRALEFDSAYSNAPILVLPSVQRIPSVLWPKNLRFALEYILDSDYRECSIKFHPSFTHSKSLLRELKRIASSTARDLGKPINIIQSGVTLEEQMRNKRLNLYGGISSLALYARLSGSEYRLIAFPDWISKAGDSEWTMLCDSIFESQFSDSI